MFTTLIIGLIAGPAVSLYGIADGVAGDAGGVRRGILAAVIAFLDDTSSRCPMRRRWRSSRWP